MALQPQSPKAPDIPPPIGVHRACSPRSPSGRSPPRGEALRGRPFDHPAEVESTRELLDRLAFALGQLEAENELLRLQSREIGPCDDSFARGGVLGVAAGDAEELKEEPRTVVEEKLIARKSKVLTRANTAMSNMARDASGDPVLPGTYLRASEADNKKPPFLRKLDTFIAGIILLNALVLAVGLDMAPLWPGWDASEYFFLFVYSSEVAVKLRHLGTREYFLGDDRYWNAFDISIVTFGFFELVTTIVTVFTRAEVSSNMGFFVRIVKIVRLTRITRIVRLLRYQIFAELKAMVLGVLSGLRVLFWAIVLFFVFIFLVAIVMRSTIGADDAFEDTFGLMPWAMFTIFRCLTDGCTAHDGTPLQVHLYAKYGAVFSLSYMGCFLFVTIGLFNLIMAIFVDNVMESTRHRRQLERAEDSAKTERYLRKLVGKLIKRDHPALKRQAAMVEWTGGFPPVHKWLAEFLEKRTEHIVTTCPLAQEDLSSQSSASFQQAVTPEIFNEWLAVPEFSAMLEALEISSSNPRELFDVLDADMSQELNAEELVVGLMNLRGPAEKSYTVASLLCIRVVQEILRNFIAESEDRHASLIRTVQQGAERRVATPMPSGQKSKPSERSARFADDRG